MEFPDVEGNGKNKKFLYDGNRISTGYDGKILDIKVGDGHTTLGMSLLPWNYRLKNV